MALICLHDEYIQHKGEEASSLWISQVIDDKGLVGYLIEENAAQEYYQQWHPA